MELAWEIEGGVGKTSTNAATVGKMRWANNNIDGDVLNSSTIIFYFFAMLGILGITPG